MMQFYANGPQVIMFQIIGTLSHCFYRIFSNGLFLTASLFQPLISSNSLSLFCLLESSDQEATMIEPSSISANLPPIIRLFMIRSCYGDLAAPSLGVIPPRMILGRLLLYATAM